ncbi:MAG: RNA 2',3'-cyclic phosphodiesterase [Lachnospiraceae bacterium]|nr:RNA 2',3'-cyclic phosphodiesterase [Lachnospiraceae bacterium]
MRLFISIQFNGPILDSLTEFQDDLKDQGVTGNFSSRENLHITLAFIGEYNDPDAVFEAMEASDFRPFDIKLEGVGHFGDLFWVGLANNPALNAYVKRLRHCLADNGIPFDKKRFSPHITLIRKAGYKYGDEIPVYDVPRGSMRVERITLMRSDRGKHGMIYTELGDV